jgi:hypothetical protein
MLLEQAARTIRNRRDTSAGELALEVHAAASLLVALQQASRSCGVRVPQRVSVQRLRHWALMLGSQPDVPSVGGHAR